MKLKKIKIKAFIYEKIQFFKSIYYNYFLGNIFYRVNKKQ